MNTKNEAIKVPVYKELFSESVYNLQPHLDEEHANHKRYVSIYNRSVADHYRQSPLRSTTKSVGAPKMKPGSFLRKYSKKKPVRLPDAQEVKSQRDDWHRFLTSTPGRVVHQYHHPLRASKPTVKKNWEDLNKKKVKDSRRTAGHESKVNQPSRHEQAPRFLGLISNYRNKKDFGTVPRYIQRYRQVHMDQQKHSIAAQKAEEQLKNSTIRVVSEEERQNVLHKLQEYFDRTMQIFQGLSVVLDNQSKIKDRLHLEKELNEIEKNIDNLKSHKVIIVKKDDSI